MEMEQQLHPRGNGLKGRNPMTEEERRIRDELEEEVEQALEEEIKDGIYHLALRLRQLYESRKERMMKSNEGRYAAGKMKSLSEVNIYIKMKGDKKVEIREAKKEATAERLVGCRRSSSRVATRLDWAKSLRSVNVLNKREPFRFG